MDFLPFLAAVASPTSGVLASLGFQRQRQRKRTKTKRKKRQRRRKTRRRRKRRRWREQKDEEEGEDKRRGWREQKDEEEGEDKRQRRRQRQRQRRGRRQRNSFPGYFIIRRWCCKNWVYARHLTWYDKVRTISNRDKRKTKTNKMTKTNLSWYDKVKMDQKINFYFHQSDISFTIWY